MQIIKVDHRVDFSIHKDRIRPRATPALDYTGLAEAWFLIGFKKIKINRLMLYIFWRFFSHQVRKTLH